MKAIEYRCAACGSPWLYHRKPTKCDVCGDDEMVKTGHVKEIKKKVSDGQTALK